MRKVIAALRAAANTISTTGVFEWSQHDKCNCGWVARHLLGLSDVDIMAKLTEVWEKVLVDGPYTVTAERNEKLYCSVSNMPVDNLFRLLHEEGLTKQEIKDLEYLANTEVQKRAGFDAANGIASSCPINHRYAFHSIRYMKQSPKLLRKGQSHASTYCSIEKSG